MDIHNQLSIIISLKPTYKGLKRSSTQLGGQNLVRLKPTYKGLKPLSEGAEEIFIDSLKPTYKGLKHHGYPQPTINYH